MNTAKKFQTKAYLSDNAKLDALIREIVENAAQDLEGYKSVEDSIEEVECQRRDGFIPFDHNRGGYQATQFTDVSYIVGSGTFPASKEATKKINEYYDRGVANALTQFKEDCAAELVGIPDDKVNYHDLYELGHGSLAERLSELENEYTGGDDNSIMYQVRIMYHGTDDKGVHSASVSACVNWEGPYHRSHINWMPGFKCEAAKEVTVTFKTLREAKSKLTKAMKLVTSKIL